MTGSGSLPLVRLLRASHPGPSVAVSLVTVGLAVTAGLGAGRGLLVVAAVLAGQLSIGWSNDLLDVERDRAVGRTDKPAATGEVSVGVLRSACAAALVVCVVLSLLCGWRSGLVHLGLGVAAGWSYNLGLKRTPLSPLPYAVAFGALPSVVTLAAGTLRPAPVWMTATGVLLGISAHLLNVLPDLDDDARTGVRGLPHRMGARTTRVVALVLLTAGTVVAALGPGRPPGWVVAALVVAAVGGVTAAVGVGPPGRHPFATGVVIALLDVVLLVLRSVA